MRENKKGEVNTQTRKQTKHTSRRQIVKNMNS